MNSPFNPTPVAPEVAAAQNVKLIGNQLFNQMVKSYMVAFNLVWNNPNATPDKVVTAMGVDAQKVFALSGALATYLVNAGATGIPTTMPTGWNYVANNDGSVTLTKAV